MKNEEMTKITSYMRLHLNDNISIEEIAKHFGYSKFYFTRKFKKYFKVSPNEYMSALRIEQIYLDLGKNESILNTHLDAGYLSPGTFSNTFLKKTGMSPNEYKKNLDIFYKKMHLYETKKDEKYTYYGFEKNDYRAIQPFSLKVYVKAPENFQGTIFVGIFNKALPNEAPIVGKALINNQIDNELKSVRINRIPNGEYYAMVVAVEKFSSPISYFNFNNSLRDIDRESIIFPLEQEKEILLTLREKRDDDPPITFNPVKLLIKVIEKGNLG